MMGPICRSLSFLTNNRCSETIDKLTQERDASLKKIRNFELEAIRAITEIQEQKAINHYQAYDFEKQIVVLEKQLTEQPHDFERQIAELEQQLMLCKREIGSLERENKSLRNNKKDNRGQSPKGTAHQ